MPASDIPLPGPLSNIPVVGPVYDLAGHLIGHLDPQGRFVKAAEKAGASAAKNVVSDIFHGIHVDSLIIRVVEVMLGIVLIGIGVAKLTGADNFVMKTATKAGKAALLA
jgi:hypothetical protein